MAKRYKFSQDAEEIHGLLNKIDSLDLNQQCRCSPSCELENIKLDNVVYSCFLYFTFIAERDVANDKEIASWRH